MVTGKVANDALSSLLSDSLADMGVKDSKKSKPMSTMRKVSSGPVMGAASFSPTQHAPVLGGAENPMAGVRRTATVSGAEEAAGTTAAGNFNFDLYSTSPKAPVAQMASSGSQSFTGLEDFLGMGGSKPAAAKQGMAAMKKNKSGNDLLSGPAGGDPFGGDLLGGMGGAPAAPLSSSPAPGAPTPLEDLLGGGMEDLKLHVDKTETSSLDFEHLDLSPHSSAGAGSVNSTPRVYSNTSVGAFDILNPNPIEASEAVAVAGGGAGSAPSVDDIFGTTPSSAAATAATSPGELDFAILGGEPAPAASQGNQSGGSEGGDTSGGGDIFDLDGLNPYTSDPAPEAPPSQPATAAADGGDDLLGMMSSAPVGAGPAAEGPGSGDPASGGAADQGITSLEDLMGMTGASDAPAQKEGASSSSANGGGPQPQVIDDIFGTTHQPSVCTTSAGGGIDFGMGMGAMGGHGGDGGAGSARDSLALQEEEIDPNEPEIRKQLREKRQKGVQQRMALALEEARERETIEAMEKAERSELAQYLGPKLEAWAKGKSDNIRALLSTLQDVLWEGSRWKEVSMMDLMNPAQVKKQYRKAMIIMHPDKVKQKGGTTEQIFIADYLFDLTNQAWGHFQMSEM